MISWRSKSFYENRFESDYSVTDRPIWVNACGVDKLYGLETDYTIARPQGRQDYQLIYLRSGYAAHLVNGREVLLKEHGLALYRPGEPQLYRYLSTSRTRRIGSIFRAARLSRFCSGLATTLS